VPLKRLFASGCVAALAATAYSAPAASAAGRCWNPKAREIAFLRKMNQARGSLRHLRLDPQLSKVARTHTRAMTRRNELFHSSPSQLSRRITGWKLLGENVGFGSTVASLHRAFMASSGHRANIRHPRFRHVGIGVRRGHGGLWVTVIFQSRSDPGTTLRMPSC
jgi:uncharacterized protein YkwD